MTMIIIATILGPALVAPLIVFFGPLWALLINAASFVVSFATMWAIRIPASEPVAPPTEQPAFFKEFRLGLRTVFGVRVLLTLLVSAIVGSMLAGSLDSTVLHLRSLESRPSFKRGSYHPVPFRKPSG